jgi:hypothetical protein
MSTTICGLTSIINAYTGELDFIDDYFEEYDDSSIKMTKTYERQIKTYD